MYIYIHIYYIYMHTYVHTYISTYISIYDVVCYREREREINSPILLCLNQQSLRLTAKTVGE